MAKVFHASGRGPVTRLPDAPPPAFTEATLHWDPASATGIQLARVKRKAAPSWPAEIRSDVALTVLADICEDCPADLFRVLRSGVVWCAGLGGCFNCHKLPNAIKARTCPRRYFPGQEEETVDAGP